MIAEKITFIVGLVLILLVLLPVSGTVNIISPRDVVFLGENDLDLTSFIQEPINIGNFPLGEQGYSLFEAGEIPSEEEEPVDVERITDPEKFWLIPDIFFDLTGDWYSWEGEKLGDLLFILKEPSLSLKVWDNTANKEIKDQEIPQGHLIDFIIETNMWSVSDRSGYTPKDAPISLVLTGPDDYVISSLSTTDGEKKSLQNLPVNSEKWSLFNENEEKTSDSKEGWDTVTYEPGIYEVYAIADLNNIINTLTAPDGSKYTGKTISKVKKIEIKGERSSNSKLEIVETEKPSQEKVTITSPTPTIRIYHDQGVTGTSN